MTKSLPEYHPILLYSFFLSPQTTHTHTHKFLRPKQSSQNRHQKQGMNLGT
jgi:hypothetical protein